MKVNDILKRIKKAKPDRDVLLFERGKLNVRVTSSSLFSDINSDLPNSDIIDYLYDIASSTTDDLRMIFPKECDIERIKIVYLNYLSLAIKRDLKELKSIRFKILGFFFFGIIVLTLSYFLEGISARFVYDSVNIIGGFSIWEAADVFFFARSEKRREMFVRLRLVKSDWVI